MDLLLVTLSTSRKLAVHFSRITSSSPFGWLAFHETIVLKHSCSIAFQLVSEICISIVKAANCSRSSDNTRGVTANVDQSYGSTSPSFLKTYGPPRSFARRLTFSRTNLKSNTPRKSRPDQGGFRRLMGSIDRNSRTTLTWHFSPHRRTFRPESPQQVRHFSEKPGSGLYAAAMRRNPRHSLPRSYGSLLKLPSRIKYCCLLSCS